MLYQAVGSSFSGSKNFVSMLSPFALC